MGPLALWVREVLAPVSGLAGLMVAGEALLGSVAGPLLKRLQRLPLPRWVLMYTLMLLLGLVSLVAGNDPVLVVALPLAVRAGLLLGFDECSSAALLVLSVNVASAASPLGNPQNMIVAAVYGA
ncbi:MAG: hypothetical protein GXO15_03635, partial [Crenarchaeota archaeon]|nr:hypothetical protein [Thermoproteota archaeon]